VTVEEGWYSPMASAIGLYPPSCYFSIGFPEEGGNLLPGGRND